MISFSRMIFSVWLDGHFLPFLTEVQYHYGDYILLFCQICPIFPLDSDEFGKQRFITPIKSILDSPGFLGAGSSQKSPKYRFEKLRRWIWKNPFIDHKNLKQIPLLLQGFDSGSAKSTTFWSEPNPTKTGHEIPVSCKNSTFCQQFWWTFWVSSSSLGWSFLSQRTWNKSSNFIFPVYI